jgi:uncharacterized membrane protein YphA (DoxX/SURF4 family)
MIDTAFIAAILLIARLALAAVFAITGTAKFRDPEGTSQMLRAFGTPQFSVYALAQLLPATELMIAVLLLPTPTARCGGVAASITLAAFTLVIIANLATGRRPECRRFGMRSPVPIGAGVLFRNVALLIVAVLISLHPAVHSDQLAIASSTIWRQNPQWGLQKRTTTS